MNFVPDPVKKCLQPATTTSDNLNYCFVNKNGVTEGPAWSFLLKNARNSFGYKAIQKSMMPISIQPPLPK